MMMVGGATVPDAKAQAIPDGQSGWDREAAAQYLDDRINLWFERATELRTGQGKTSCISCHTVVPYLLARPALRKAMQVAHPTQQEVKLLKEIAQRVETYPDHESMSDAKHGGERGTEAALNALILARQDRTCPMPRLRCGALLSRDPKRSTEQTPASRCQIVV